MEINHCGVARRMTGALERQAMGVAQGQHAAREKVPALDKRLQNFGISLAVLPAFLAARADNIRGLGNGSA